MKGSLNLQFFFIFSASMSISIASVSVFLLTIRLDRLPVCVSICLSVCLSVWKVICGKMAEWIRLPFGMVGRVSRVMGVLDGGSDRRRGRGSFGCEFGASHCN